jgi:hypothetical protein
MNKEDVKRRFSSTYLKAKAGAVNNEKGIIEGVSVCTAGEAKGHGVSLDSEFIDSVVGFGNEKKQGLKARFGHPNMCSTALGTFLGRFKNFRREGEQALADLFLSNEAKDTPNGNLYDSVLGMAKNESDMFGTSIVFSPGRAFRKDENGNKWFQFCRESYEGVEVWYENEDAEKREDEEGLSDELYIECAELHACDTVDEPAANEGLFSKFAQESIAGQVTEFLDLNPQVWEALSANPDILKALSLHAAKLDEFIAKYQTYKSKEGAIHMSEETKNPAEGSEEPAAIVPETPETQPEAAEPEAAPATEETGTIEQQSKTIDAVEFEGLMKEFGAEIAAKVALSGGGISEGRKLRIESLEAENKQLKKENELLGGAKGGSPAQASSDAKGKVSAFRKNRD